MRLMAQMAPRNTIRGAKTRDGSTGGSPPNMPSLQRPSKDAGAYRFLLRAVTWLTGTMAFSTICAVRRSIGEVNVRDHSPSGVGSECG
jgi:hypothetical protein